MATVWMLLGILREKLCSLIEF